ncbi:hypothetical protein FRC08_001181 [Ceratobasidium sp. 394]|nr:hypothetical protein FRC08_001181 [Ceratobasidium sp. 394]KAG9101159.1 hypothetical protein FS749_009878 [Ceratobasidium sp. UAMH 11750]
MAHPYYDPDTEGTVYLVTPGEDDDYDDSDMDTISSASTMRTASTITSDEIGEYFREAHGKTYPLDENLPLTYPVDEIEIRRHQMQHVILKALVHGNYVGPVKHVLRPRADGTRPRILDIRTCCGTWAQEMAAEFPHCDIVSVDVAPITTHAPRPNIAFEVYDLYAGVAEPDESFDYVSCRHVQLAVKEYDRLIFDLHRVLRPGGLITICEVENCLYEVDEPPYTTRADRSFPNVVYGIELMRAAITDQGVDLDAIYHVGDWLRPNSDFWRRTGEKYGIPAPRTSQASKGFTNIHTQQVLVPTGTWHPDPAVSQVGNLVTRLWMMAWKQLEGMLAEGGLDEDEARRVSRACIDEFQNGQKIPCVAKYWMISGIKAEAPREAK